MHVTEARDKRLHAVLCHSGEISREGQPTGTDRQKAELWLSGAWGWGGMGAGFPFGMMECTV